MDRPFMALIERRPRTLNNDMTFWQLVAQGISARQSGTRDGLHY